MFRLLFLIALFNILPAAAIAVEAPMIFFGLELGKPLPKEVILPLDSSEVEKAIKYISGCDMRSDNQKNDGDIVFDRFENACSRCTEDELAKSRAILSGQLFSFIAEGKNENADLAEYFDKKIGHIFIAIDPPSKNLLFDAYVAKLSPKSNNLIRIDAYGYLSHCSREVLALESHFVGEFHFLEKKTSSTPYQATLTSESLEILISCFGISIIDRSTDFVEEIEQKLQEAFADWIRETEIDFEGL